MSKETISSAVVELALDSTKFDDGIKNVNKYTKLMEQNFNTAKKTLALSEKSMEDYTKVIEAGESAIQGYNKKIGALNKTYKEQEQKLKGYIQQQKELPDTIAKAEAKLKELETTLGKNSQEYKKAENELKTYRQQFNGMDSTIAKTVNNMKSLENQVSQTKNKMSQAENKVNNFRTELKEIGNTSEQTGNETSSAFDKIKNSIGEVNLSDFTGQIDGLDNGLVLLELGAKGAGLALAGMFTASILDGASEFDKAIFDLRTTLGLTADQAHETKEKLQEISLEGYDGENLTDAYTRLKQTFKDMNDNELETTAKNLTILNDMGFENGEVIKAMSKMMKAWGLTSEEALGLIIEGHQQGLNATEDWLDTLTEYPSVLADMGISSTDFFNMMVQGFDETGASSDNLADVFKELGLKITEGSDDTKLAFKELGLNYDSFKKQIDNGSITMPEAISKVTKALSGVKDETDRAELAQRLLGGTYEYTGTYAVDSNNKIISSTGELVNAVDEVNQAYDESYEKSKRELSSEWNKLTQTLGSALIPMLTAVLEGFNRTIDVSKLAVTNFGIQIQTWANNLKCFMLEVGTFMLETLAKLPFAEKIMPNLDSTLAQMKTSHEETIKYIQCNEEKMRKNSELINKQFEVDKENTYSNVANTADQKTKEMATAVDKNTKDAKEKAKSNTDGLKSDVEGALSGLGNIATTSTGEIPKATQQNLNASSQIIKQFGTDAYLGVKTSFYKLETSAKQSMTNLYKGCSTSMYKTKGSVMHDATTMYNQSKKSFDALSLAGRQAFTNLYKGVTTSSSKMKSQVLADWNSIRNTLSKGITGNVSVQKTVTTQTLAKTIDAQDVSRAMPMAIDATEISYRASDYQPKTIVSTATKAQTISTNNTVTELRNQNALLANMLNILMSERTTVVENNITLDGRSIAKGTAKYIEGEINSITKRSNRLAGVF